MSAEISDRDDKWLQIRYKHVHADLQWAKGQAWSALQWTILLIAAIYWASKNYVAIGPKVWVGFVFLMTLISVWWQIDLFNFSRKTRQLGIKLEAGLNERHPDLKGVPALDYHHVTLFVLRLLVILCAAGVTLIQLWS